MATKTQSVERLFADLPKPKTVPEPFKPHARYLADMDMLMFLTEDCSYATERVDAYLSLFWHPTEDRVVGLKLKGFKHVFNKIKDGMGATDEHWVSIYKVLEQVFTRLMSESEGAKVQYTYAKTVAGAAKIDRRLVPA